MKPDVYAANCPTRQILDRVGDKWAVLILLLLREEAMRFNRLRRTIEGISQKMLIQTLRKLECYGLVTRTVYPVVPPKVEYALTPLGFTLLEPLYAICHWTDDHWEEMQVAARQFQENLPSSKAAQKVR